MGSRVLAAICLAASSVDAIFLQHNVDNVRPAAVPSRAQRRKVSRDPYAVYDGKYLVKLSACSKSAVDVVDAALKHSDCDFLSEEGRMRLPSNGCGEQYVVCPAETAEKLASKSGISILNKDGHAPLSKMAAAIANRDAGALFRSTDGGTTHGWDSKSTHTAAEFYSKYRDLDAIEQRLKKVVASSGGLAVLEELMPKTYEGRTIKAVRIRDAQWVVGRPRIVLTFQLHAREWITGMTGCYIVEHLIKAVKQDKYSVAGMEIVLVPISNPDGFVYSATTDRLWRKNRRINHGCGARDYTICDGVDLNRNFETPDNVHAYDEVACCSQTYNGPSNRSEPESQAIGKLFEEAPVLIHLDVHSFGQMVMGPYSYTVDPHSDNSKIHELGDSMKTAIAKTHGTKYTYEVSGLVGIGEVSGTISDWSTDNGAYGYIYELRPLSWDFSIPADQILPTAEETVQGVYVAIDWARNRGPAM